MAAKLTYEIGFGGNEDAVEEFVAELAAQPAHKWIPISQIREEGTATVTPRQADWLAKQVEKKVKGSSMNFSVTGDPEE